MPPLLHPSPSPLLLPSSLSPLPSPPILSLLPSPLSPPPLRNVRILITLILGQFLSFLLCGTGVTSQLLVTDYSVSVPTTQLFLVYIFLGAVYGVPVVVRSDFLTILRQNWWKYIILGVVDLEANYLVVLAYKYTNITVVQVSGGCAERNMHCGMSLESA